VGALLVVVALWLVLLVCAVAAVVFIVLDVDCGGGGCGGGGWVGGKRSGGGGHGRTGVWGQSDEAGGRVGELLRGGGQGPLGSRISGCHGASCCWWENKN